MDSKELLSNYFTDEMLQVRLGPLYAPPLYRVLWRIGVNVPPPVYSSFVGNILFFTLLSAIWVTLLCCVVQLFLLVVFDEATLIFQMFISGNVVVGLVNCWSACKYRSAKRLLGLGNWKDYKV